MEAVKVWFPINNIYIDTLDSICGATYGGISISHYRHHWYPTAG